MFKNDWDKFEEQEMKKIKPIIKTWFDQSIEQNVMGNKPKIITDKLNSKIIADILKLFERKEETEHRIKELKIE